MLFLRDVVPSLRWMDTEFQVTIWFMLMTRPPVP
jgi:hypothetical protein